MPLLFTTIIVRCDCRRLQCWNGNEEVKGNGMRRRNLVFARHAQITASASPLSSNQAMKKNTPHSKIYQEVDFAMIII